MLKISRRWFGHTTVVDSRSEFLPDMQFLPLILSTAAWSCAGISSFHESHVDPGRRWFQHLIMCLFLCPFAKWTPGTSGYRAHPSQLTSVKRWGTPSTRLHLISRLTCRGKRNVTTQRKLHVFRLWKKWLSHRETQKGTRRICKLQMKGPEPCRVMILSNQND